MKKLCNLKSFVIAEFKGYFSNLFICKFITN